MKKKRVWSHEEFTAAYMRYLKFYSWMRDEVTGNPDFKTMWEQYTKDEGERMELRVVYEVVRLQRKHGFKIADIKAVRLGPDGGVDVDV